mmetsp:Transcript_6732/g.7732  ORF Transcript_6732/g.7732 Transcript_6732/m.7732 type:complete len:222 (+) Transcript_6732:444-1109(+)
MFALRRLAINSSMDKSSSFFPTPALLRLSFSSRCRCNSASSTTSSIGKSSIVASLLLACSNFASLFCLNFFLFLPSAFLDFSSFLTFNPASTLGFISCTTSSKLAISISSSSSPAFANSFASKFPALFPSLFFFLLFLLGLLVPGIDCFFMFEVLAYASSAMFILRRLDFNSVADISSFDTPTPAALCSAVGPVFSSSGASLLFCIEGEGAFDGDCFFGSV